MTHTPGPWHIEAHGGRGVAMISSRAAHWTGFAEVITHKNTMDDPRLRPSPEGLANAALIAAAPDLLEALKAALPRMAHPAKCHSVRPTEEWAEHGSASFANCTCEISVARAAIAKAEQE